jgi:hypothetical protein
MYQNMMIGVVILIALLVAQRVYRSWQTEKPPGQGTGKTRQFNPGKRSGTMAPKGGGDHGMSAEPYHCVTLEGRCAALGTYKGKRFLASNAPPLPVPDCTSGRCQCHYTHHADRRATDTDRRLLGRLADEQYSITGKSERRGAHGRRKSDGNWATVDDWSNAV